ncbi:MAG: hypothetical protein RLZZ06_466, partial [Actinomycetota bacterium]
MSDADYELWAAMMADDEEKPSPAPAVSVAVEPAPVVVAPPVAVDEPKFFPLTPVAQPEPTPVEVPEPEPIVQPEPVELSVEEDEDEPEFPTNLFKEPQTNSITVQEVPDALNAEIVTDSGEV